MINNTMYWGVVIQGEKPTDPWLTIAPLATMKEAEAYRKFACPHDIGLDKAHVISIVPKNRYGAPLEYEGPDGEDGPWAEGWEERSGEKNNSVYPFPTEEYPDADDG